MQAHAFWALALILIDVFLIGVEANHTQPARLRPKLQPKKRHINALYYANYDSVYSPSQLPVAELTHIYYAFASVNVNGTVSGGNRQIDTVQKTFGAGTITAESLASSPAGRIAPALKRQNGNQSSHFAYGAVQQLFYFKTQKRNLKVLVSIGGGSAKTKFQSAAANDTTRATFCQTAVKLTTDWGFDGIDIDWEYPTATTDRANFIKLLRTCTIAFNTYSLVHRLNYQFTISVAISAKSSNYVAVDVPAMEPYVNLWNLLAYDYSGNYSTVATHQSNVFMNDDITDVATDNAVTYYLGQGMTPRKLQLGIPLYGRAFENTSGLGQPFHGIGPGGVQTSGKYEAGVYYNNQLPRAGATQLYDSIAQAAYSYDNATREFITYEDEQSVDYKALYLQRRGLGGAFFFEARGDRTGAGSRVVEMGEALGSLDTARNNLNYPTSQYANIRDGNPLGTARTPFVRRRRFG